MDAAKSELAPSTHTLSNVTNSLKTAMNQRDCTRNKGHTIKDKLGIT